jgi:hypothetical protein
MMRMFFWTCFVVLTLNIFTFNVKYTDGLSIYSQGWPDRLGEYYRQWVQKR